MKISLIYTLVTIFTVYTIVNILLLFLSYFVFGHLIHIFKITKTKEIKTSVYDFILFFVPLISWLAFCYIFRSKTNKSLEIAAIETIIICLQTPFFWFIKLFIEPTYPVFARLLIITTAIMVSIALLFLFPTFYF